MWAVLLERSKATRAKYLDSTVLDTGQCHGDVLAVIFDPLMHAFSVTFDALKQKESAAAASASIRFVLPIANDQLLRLVLSALYNLALFVHNMSDRRKLDRLLERLSQLSGLSEASQSHNSYSGSYCKKEGSHLLFGVVHDVTVML